MITLSRELLEEIRTQALREMPNEACGYLAGRRSGDSAQVVFRIPMTNIDESPEHFRFDPAEQFGAMRRARDAGMDLVAIYHSHPETPARMSDEDIRLANDVEKDYLIYSVSDDRIACFRINKEKVVYTEEVSFVADLSGLAR